MKEVTIKSLFMVGCPIVLGIVLALFIIDSMTFDNNYSNSSSDNNYNNSSSSNNNSNLNSNKISGKEKLVNYLIENGYFEDSTDIYIDSNPLVQEQGTIKCSLADGYDFKHNYYVYAFACNDNGTTAYEQTIEYYWNLDMVEYSAFDYQQFSSTTAFLYSDGSYSCGGNTCSSNVKAHLEETKNDFLKIISNLGLSVKDIN